MNGADDQTDAGLDQLIHVAPIGVVIVTADLTILAANVHAIELTHCNQGDSFASLVHRDDKDKLGNLLEDPALTSELRLDLEAGSKTVEIRSAIAESGDRHAIFLVDISERVALGRQLQSSRLPSRKLLYQLNVAATTMSGYAELIDLMLDEEPIVSGERLNVIRRYHREVRDNLDTMLRLLKIEREGGRRPDSPAIPIRRKQVVVVDDEPAIAEFISELMKGMKFRVVTFTDAAEALSFLSAESDGVDLVITDHVPDGPGDLDFTRSVLALPAAFPVVICSELEGEFVDAPRAYVCHKPIDITELSRIVADLIPE